VLRPIAFVDTRAVAFAYARPIVTRRSGSKITTFTRFFQTWNDAQKQPFLWISKSWKRKHRKRSLRVRKIPRTRKLQSTRPRLSGSVNHLQRRRGWILGIALTSSSSGKPTSLPTRLRAWWLSHPLLSTTLYLFMVALVWVRHTFFTQSVTKFTAASRVEDRCRHLRAVRDQLHRLDAEPAAPIWKRSWRRIQSYGGVPASYREEPDVLLVDDIQFLSARTAPRTSFSTR